VLFEPVLLPPEVPVTVGKAVSADVDEVGPEFVKVRVVVNVVDASVTTDSKIALLDWVYNVDGVESDGTGSEELEAELVSDCVDEGGSPVIAGAGFVAELIVDHNARS
jgi:hypothetical protein